MVRNETDRGCVRKSSRGFVYETCSELAEPVDEGVCGSMGERRQDGAILTVQGLSVWEWSAGAQTQEVYDAPEHLHGILVDSLGDMCRILECEQAEVLRALSLFFGAGGFLSDLMSALDAYGIAYAYGSCSRFGKASQGA